jgi:hypothetical protein
LPGFALDRQVDCIQQLRQLLDFVDDNLFLIGICLQKRDQPFGSARILSQDRSIEQINSQSVLELLSAPRCLASAARPQQEKMPFGCLERSWNEGRGHRKNGNYDSILRRIMAIAMPFRNRLSSDISLIQKVAAQHLRDLSNRVSQKLSLGFGAGAPMKGC